MRFVVGAAILACVCATAHAKDRGKAQAAYQAATQHYELGEYREALDGFKEAYRNFEDPIFIFNLAQCQRQLGEKQQAIRSYRMYLIKVPDARNRDKVRATVGRLEKELAEDRPPPQPIPPPPPPSPKEQPSANPTPPAASAPPEAEAPTPEAEPHRPVQPIAIAQAPAPTPTRRAPVYKRWWLWTAVGAAVAVGVAVGVGVGMSQSENTPMLQTDFGTFRF